MLTLKTGFQLIDVLQFVTLINHSSL